MTTDNHTATQHEFTRRCLRFFCPDYVRTPDEHNDFEEELQAFAEGVIHLGGYNLDTQLAALTLRLTQDAALRLTLRQAQDAAQDAAAERDALTRLTQRQTEALQTLTVISERREVMITDLFTINGKLEAERDALLNLINEAYEKLGGGHHPYAAGVRDALGYVLRGKETAAALTHAQEELEDRIK
jgi:hypothetical protein